MPKITALRLNKDFRRLYGHGKSKAHPLMVTYSLRNRLGLKRIGITASKKVGDAVHRNRARRLIKEAYRLLEPGVPTGWDFVFVARKAAAEKTVKMRDVMAVMEKQIKTCTG